MSQQRIQARGVVGLDKPFLPPITAFCSLSIKFFYVLHFSNFKSISLADHWLVGEYLKPENGAFLQDSPGVIPYLCLLTKSIPKFWMCLCVLKLTPTFHLYIPSGKVIHLQRLPEPGN